MKYLRRNSPSLRAPRHGLARKAKKANRLFSRHDRRTLVEALEDRRLLSVNVLTDKADYLGGSTAYFTASGFDPGGATYVTPVTICRGPSRYGWDKEGASPWNLVRPLSKKPSNCLMMN